MRLAPLRHCAPAAASEPRELPIPMPPSTSLAAWQAERAAVAAETERRLIAQAARMNELGCSVHQAMDLALGPDERIRIELPEEDAPPPTLEDRLANERQQGRAEGHAEGVLERSRADLFVGLVWGLFIGALAIIGTIKAGMWAGATASLVVAVPVPLQRRPAARSSAWFVQAPYRACDVCAHGVDIAGDRCCRHAEVIRYAGEPICVADARGRAGMCGTDARHHQLPT